MMNACLCTSAIIAALLACAAYAAEASNQVEEKASASSSPACAMCAAPERYCTAVLVPDVRGLREDGARKKLEAHLSNVRTARLPRATVPAAHAVLTRPRFGQRVCKDTEVVLFVAVPADPPPKRPDIAVQIVKYELAFTDGPPTPDPPLPAPDPAVLSPLVLSGGLAALGLASVMGYRYGRSAGDEAIRAVVPIDAPVQRAEPNWRVRRDLEPLDTDPA
jgi:hypothetical protein